MSRYWSPIVHTLSPYVPGEQPRDRGIIKLNTNENPYPPSPRVVETIRGIDPESLRRYPDPESTRLAAALARHHDVADRNVFIGNGSDEVLAHAFQAFFQDKGPLLFPDISYSFYPVYCRLYGIDYEQIALRDDLSIGIEDYAVDNGGIILPNPNAPTGRALPLRDIAALCRGHASSLIVIDEAYVDFGGESAIPLTVGHDNLLVVQTFSKSRSLAGLRLGYAIGHPALIEGLSRVKNSFNSYPIDAIAQQAALAALADDDYFRERCRTIIATRAWLTEALAGLGFEVVPSAANFVFARHPAHRGEGIYQALRDRGVLVRHFGQERIADYLRITVGTDEECRTLIARLEEIVN